MSKLYVNGESVSSSVNYASAISCIDQDGNKSTVQAEIDKNKYDIDELNDKLTPISLVTELSSDFIGGLYAYKIGNILLIRITVSNNNDIDIWSDIIIGTIQNVKLPMDFDFVLSSQTATGIAYNGLIDSNGNVIIHSRMTSLEKGSWLRATTAVINN